MDCRIIARLPHTHFIIWEERTTGTQLHMRQRSPYKCSSTLHYCTTRSNALQCIAFHGQIKVIIQFPSITLVVVVNRFLIHHCKSAFGELKLHVLANVSGREKAGSLLPLGKRDKTTQLLPAMTNSQLA